MGRHQPGLGQGHHQCGQQGQLDEGAGPRDQNVGGNPRRHGPAAGGEGQCLHHARHDAAAGDGAAQGDIEVAVEPPRMHQTHHQRRYQTVDRQLRHHGGQYRRRRHTGQYRRQHRAQQAADHAVGPCTDQTTPNGAREP